MTSSVAAVSPVIVRVEVLTYVSVMTPVVVDTEVSVVVLGTSLVVVPVVSSRIVVGARFSSRSGWDPTAEARACVMSRRI